MLSGGGGVGALHHMATRARMRWGTGRGNAQERNCSSNWSCFECVIRSFNGYEELNLNFYYFLKNKFFISDHRLTTRSPGEKHILIYIYR